MRRILTAQHKRYGSYSDISVNEQSWLLVSLTTGSLEAWRTYDRAVDVGEWCRVRTLVRALRITEGHPEAFPRWFTTPQLQLDPARWR